MNSRTLAFCAIAAASAAFHSPVSFADCAVTSGANTAALVELYTSQGCSSCPPADRRLSRLRETMDPGAEVVALALHVDYWDYIGWKDPFAHGVFGQRQRWLAHASNLRTVYTPQFFVGGSALGLSPAALKDEVRRINGTAAAASIRLKALLAQSGSLEVSAEAMTFAGTDPAALYLAVAENGLVSKVTRGENGGKTLSHDHVVRAWIGPIALNGGSAQVRREIDLAPAWNRARLDLVAFVQHERTGKVLQAVRARQCASASREP